MNRTILVGGDLYVNDSNIEISDNLVNLFTTSKFRLLNLEAPIVNEVNKVYPKAGPNIYQSKDVLLGIFKKLKINILSLANNHMIDYGYQGFLNTKSILKNIKIKYSGFGENSKLAAKPIVFRNERIVIITAAEEEFGVATDYDPGINSIYSKKIIDEIYKYSQKKYFVLVYVHGGGEEIPLPSEYVKERYREFIDFGASLIVGHHPHVVQIKEKYKNKWIYYSLGNFIHSAFKKSWGLLLKVDLSKSLKLDLHEYVVQVNNNRMFIDSSEKWRNFLNIFNKCNNYDGLYDEQSLYMYKSYYRDYFKRVDRDQLLLMHLLRNNSHRDFINQALKISTGEVKSRSNLKTKLMFNKLLKIIK